MENQSLQIATTIRQQLLTLGRIKVWSWGSNSWSATKDGLAFKVHGFKFKGKIIITLTPSDVYKIEFIKNGQVEKTYDDVYFDEMCDLIT